MIVTVDVGSTYIKAIGFENHEKAVRPIVCLTDWSNGIKKGIITNIDEASTVIHQILLEIERKVDERVEEVVIGINGRTMGIQPCQGVVSITNELKQVTLEQVKRVHSAASYIVLPPTNEVVNIIPKEYCVDDVEGVRDPLHMQGQRLEVRGVLGIAHHTAVQSMRTAIQRTGYKCAGLYLIPLSLSEGLTLQEKQEGTILIDFGGETTTITTYADQEIQSFKQLPIGVHSITKDLSFALDTSIDEAETLKCQWASLLDLEDNFPINVRSLRGEYHMDSSVFQKIVTNRMDEILHLIAKEMDITIPVQHCLLTGGGAELEGIEDRVEDVLTGSWGVLSPGVTPELSKTYYTGCFSLLKLHQRFKKFVKQEDPIPVESEPIELIAPSTEKDDTTRIMLKDKFKNSTTGIINTVKKKTSNTFKMFFE